jgi:hypothetical protein
VIGYYRERIYSYPSVLAIQLGIHRDMRKIKTRIVLPLDLLLSDILKARIDVNRQYTLKAIVCH